MNFFKVILAVWVGMILFWGDTGAWAMGQEKQKTVKGTKVERSKKAREMTAAARSQARPVRKVTEFVKKLEGGVLYTQSGQYSLAKVKVVDLTKDRKESIGAGNLPMKTAEMTFLNGQLREVVIRQRR